MGDGSAERQHSEFRDAQVEVRISEDRMEALVTLRPALGDGRALTPEWITDEMASHGVTEGFLEREIGEAVFSVNTDHRVLKSQVLAMGKKPVARRPTFLKLQKELFEHGLAGANGKQVDFKAVSHFVVVKKGQVLGRMVPEREGHDGKTVLGEEIPRETKTVVDLEPGECIRIEGDQVLADCDGLFETKGNRFWISQKLVLDQGVDYHTGHIKFPGNVVIKGIVQDGFRLVVGGSLKVAGTLDSSGVIVRGDLLVDSGIIGRTSTQGVRVGGALRAKYVEDCAVEVRGAAEISENIYQARIYGFDKVVMGEKGRVLGSRVTAVRGGEFFRIGSATGNGSHLSAGTDFTVERKLKELNRLRTAYTMKAKSIEELPEELHQEHRNRLLEKARLAVEKIDQEIAALLPKLDVDPQAEFRVREKVYPGTVIEICRCRHEVKEEVSGVRFFLAPGGERVSVEALEK